MCVCVCVCVCVCINICIYVCICLCLQGPIFAVNSDHENIFTGGRDGLVQILDSRANTVGKVQFSSSVRSVASQGDKLIVGTLEGIAQTSKACEAPEQIIDVCASPFRAGDVWL